MSCQSAAASPEASAGLDVYYEQLRGHVVQGCVGGVLHGLAVLLHRGMAAWMQVCLPLAESMTSLPTAESQERIREPQLPALVDILANLALEQIMELHT